MWYTIAGKDVTITAKDVTVESADNAYTSQEKHEFKQSGLTVSLGGEAIKAAETITTPLQRAAEVKDDRLKALYAYKAKEALADKDTADGLKKLGRISKNDLSLSVSLGTTESESQTDSSSKAAQGSTIEADGTVAIKASTREGLGAGSNQPRFDARLDDKGTYINPFTGETGGRGVGTHIPLGE